MNGDLERRYWQAVASLPVDRRWALCELERCFEQGEVPPTPDGSLEGRLITTTMGGPIDAVLGAATRVWMPWKGKTIDAEARVGRNLFARNWRPVARVMWPGYHDVRDEGPGLMSTFAFNVWTGPSETAHEVEVLKIDYGHPGSPAFLIRRVLDEVVHVGSGVLLGQALMTWRGERRRAAWFQLRLRPLAGRLVA